MSVYDDIALLTIFVTEALICEPMQTFVVMVPFVKYMKHPHCNCCFS